MKFNDVIRKNIKFNRKTYLQYYISNMFVIAIFFSFLSLIYNKSFQSIGTSKSDIQGLVIPPMIIVFVFGIIVINYISSLFIKKRHKEFGLYMSIGMSQKDVFKIIKKESIYILIYSLVFGLFCGTIFSYVLLKLIAGVQAVQVSIAFQINIMSYILTIIFFSAAFGVIVFNNIRGIKKFNAYELMKSEKSYQKPKKFKPVNFAIGMAALVFSIISTMYFFSADKVTDIGDLKIKIAAIILIYAVGLYFFISQIGRFLCSVIKRYKHLIFNKNVNIKIESSKGIIYVSCILSAIVIFFVGVIYALYASNAKDFNNKPYDIQYLSIDNINNFSRETVKKISNDANSSIRDYKTINFLITPSNGNNFMVVSQSQYNDVFSDNLNINYHKGIWIKNDMKNKMLKNVHMGFINCKGIKIDISKMENNPDTNMGILPDIIVVNDGDYLSLVSVVGGSESKNGYIRFLNFSNSKNLYQINKKFIELSRANNKLKDNGRMYNMFFKDSFNIVSKDITDYKSTMASIGFMGGFCGIIFMLALAFVQYLKLNQEIDYEKHRYKQIYKIGMGSKYVSKNVFKEFLILFSIPLFLGALFGYVFIHMYGAVVSDIVKEINKALIVVLVYIIIQSVFFIVSFYKYRREIVANL